MRTHVCLYRHVSTQWHPPRDLSRLSSLEPPSTGAYKLDVCNILGFQLLSSVGASLMALQTCRHIQGACINKRTTSTMSNSFAAIQHQQYKQLSWVSTHVSQHTSRKFWPDRSVYTASSIAQQLQVSALHCLTAAVVEMHLGQRRPQRNSFIKERWLACLNPKRICLDAPLYPW